MYGLLCLTPAVLMVFEDFELVFEDFDYGSITFRVILVLPSGHFGLGCAVPHRPRCEV